MARSTYSYQGNGDLHELWWTNGPIGHGDLTVQSGAPPPDGSPAAYFAPTYGLQNVVYRGTDNRLHGLFWTTGASAMTTFPARSPHHCLRLTLPRTSLPPRERTT